MPAREASAGIPGIAIWADGNVQGTSDNFGGGANQNVNGAIYVPARRVKYSGGSPAITRCSQLVARAGRFIGNSYFWHDCIGAGLSEPDPRRFSPSDPFLTGSRGNAHVYDRISVRIDPAPPGEHI
jgi:hypothetical protein